MPTATSGQSPRNALVGLWYVFAVAALFFSGCARDSQSAISFDQEVIALVGATIIDGSGQEPLESQTILLADGRILAVGDSDDISIPSGATIEDVSGKTIIPGIVGVHNHLHMPGMPIDEERAALLYLAAGVTTIQTCGAANPQLELDLSAAVAAGQADGPDVFASGPYISGEGGSDVMRKPATVEEARALVRKWVEKGTTWFKVYRHAPPWLVETVIDEAHKHGAKVAGHLCATTFREATSFGIDAIEHGFNSVSDFKTNRRPGHCEGDRAYIDSLDMDGEEVGNLLAYMIEQGVVMNSTLAVFESSIDGRNRPHPRALPYISEARRDAPYVDDIDSLRQSRLHRIMAFERRFVEMGGLLGAGADAGRGVPFGFADQRNFELLVEAGFDVSHAVKIMTANGATILGSDNVGLLRSGYRADLLVLDGQLADDPAIIGNVEEVWKSGERHRPSDIYQRLLTPADE